jgi:hypothetical protein
VNTFKLRILLRLKVRPNHPWLVVQRNPLNPGRLGFGIHAKNIYSIIAQRSTRIARVNLTD